MTTIKSYTDLEQSKKLTEILPLESADMCLTFVNNMWNPVWGKADDIYQLHKDNYEPDYTKDEYIDFDEYEPKVVPCWSLAALLSVLPKKYYPIKDHETDLILGKPKDKWCVLYWDTTGMQQGEQTKADNLVDACYEMIVKLKEMNLI